MGLFRRHADPSDGGVATASAFCISTHGCSHGACAPSPSSGAPRLLASLSRALSRSPAGAGGVTAPEADASDEARAAASLAPASLRRVKSRVSDDFPLGLSPDTPAAAAPLAASLPPPAAASPRARWRAAMARCVVDHKIVIREPSVHGGVAAGAAPAAGPPPPSAAVDVPPAVSAAASAFAAAAGLPPFSAATTASPDGGGGGDAHAAGCADDEVVREIHFSGGSARLLGRQCSRGCLVTLDGGE